MIPLAPLLLKPTLTVAAAAWGVLLIEGELAAAAVGALVLVLGCAGLHRSANRGNGAEGPP